MDDDIFRGGEDEDDNLSDLSELIESEYLRLGGVISELLCLQEYLTKISNL